MFDEFTPPTDDEEAGSTFFSTAVKAVHSALRNKIVCSDKDLVGIVFFSTEHRKGDSDPEHVYILQDLDVPSAEQIQLLESIADGEYDFSEHIGSSDRYSLNDALWACGNLFSNVRTKVETKRILLFTNVDNPHSTDDDLRRQLETKARDLTDLGIEIDLMHMSSDAAKFNMDAFYRPLVVNADDEPEAQVSQGFESLLARVRCKAQKKRARMTIPWQISDDFFISIKVYNLVGSATKASYTWLDGRDNEEVTSKTRFFCSETSSPLLSTDMKYSFTYGGEKIVFDKTEVDQMRTFGSPGLLLLGFKPRSALHKEYNVKKSSFIYPDESLVGGSTRVFAAFLDRCLRLDRVPICRLIPRANSPPEFVALLPQEERVDEDGNQVVPPGFHIITLPFAEDMRSLKKKKGPEPTEEQVGAMKKLIKSMNFTGFSSEKFENPSLQKHYSVLEALALNRDITEDPPDHTKVDVEDLSSKARERSRKVAELLYPAGYDPESIASAKASSAKRKAGTGGTAKRAKTTASAEVDTARLATLHGEGNLSKLTVAELKAAIQSKGHAPRGKRKADFVEQLDEILSA
ncbi:hypothetical protein PTSG_00622 [Salpingoeca rosetta]|uniref:DNA helicase n=1 Tax=Salpingoeca rosetta (strain ATCC 50818 / BSB-021) TaxID=946362 RepID=F2TX04_SALR5|nr:uncharacterized protein PTSG_00622 [Salpingoeca rosetta]EGD75913.1 hypothetical protein PTSG_00622 [Salpingoeca rosetta]|eukprot:XP_004998089.1 hypothetical protein PTSG_00622 [Salpingoeca rosetta]